MIDDIHHRSDFSCGVSSLDFYLQTQAIKETEKQLSIAYVLNDDKKQVTGYYTLSSTMIELSNNRYFSGALINRLAVDQDHQKNGYGELLLLDALYRAYASNEKQDAFTVIVHAISKNAIRFYKKYGFTAFMNQADMLYLPMKIT